MSIWCNRSFRRPARRVGHRTVEGMISEIRVTDGAAEAVVDIEGVIGVPERMQFGEADGRVATYARFADALASIRALHAPRVVVNIRSTGGDVNDALLIFDALRALGVQVVTRCYGYVASAATIIAQAASPGCREISSGALYLIHCSESAAEGNARSLSAAKELLDRTDERIAAIYAERSGLPAERFAELMNENAGRGRWLTPEETVEAGLADAVVPSRVACTAEPADGEVAMLCRLFGLTLPPEVGGEEPEALPERPADRVRVLLRFLGRLFGRERKRPAASDVSADIVPPRPVGDVPEAPHEAAGPELPSDRAVVWSEAAQQEAYPTLTLPVEDPSNDDYRPTPNEEAYRQDALNMRPR